MMPGKRERAVFLDRDGTVIRDVGYLRRVDDLQVLPRVTDALRLLRASGFKLVLVTNQSAVARGWLTEKDLAAIHAALAAELARGGASLDAIYYCPHHPVEGTGAFRRDCTCRKPDRGMIDRAAAELAIDPASSYVVGDQASDIALARRVGATAVLIRQGSVDPSSLEEPVAVAPDLWEAALWISKQPAKLSRMEESVS